MATPSTSYSAAQHALSNPIILERIFQLILEDRKGCWSDTAPPASTDAPPNPDREPQRQQHRRPYNRWGVLVRCALVSRFWFYHAVPHIWHGSVKYTRRAPAHLAAIFARIPPDRRQYYADMVQIATVRTFSPSSSSSSSSSSDDDDSSPPASPDAVLRALSFPKLKSLYIMVHGPRIPRLPGHAVVNLAVHPWCDFCAEACCVAGVDQVFMQDLLDQVVALFPDARKVEFSDYAMAATGTMERLRHSLPRLEKLDCSLIDETDCDFFHTLDVSVADRYDPPLCRFSQVPSDDGSAVGVVQ